MASSEAVAPVEHALDGRHLDGALALSAEAGWNQVAADWRLMLGFGRGWGFSVDGRLVATAMTLPYGGRFAWICMVLVAADWRRKGLATRLLRRCLDHLREAGLTAGLDATPAGRTVYLGLGFRDTWGMQRLVFEAARLAPPAPSPGVTLRPIAGADLPALAAWDAAVFGAERREVLRHLAGRLPAAAWLAESGGRIVGYVLGRDGRRATQLGPLAADSQAIALALLARGAAAVGGRLYLDLADRQAGLRRWLDAGGASAERPLMRMVHEKSAAFDDAARLFAVAGPELG
jgi:ribosomal protein S18 acetylase RimI-like enzyme